jgi:DNA-binding response OmpR family regulator
LLACDSGLALQSTFRFSSVSAPHSDEDTVTASVKAGYDDYIVKPFNREMVLAKLKNGGLVSTNS